jgi:hypothetical protein
VTVAKTGCVKQIIPYAKFGILGLCIYILYIPSKNLEKPKQREGLFNNANKKR